MKNSGIKSQDTAAFGKVLQALLSTAFSRDNFDPFLKNMMGTLSGPSGLGARDKIAIIVKSWNGAPPKCIFKKFKREERTCLLGMKSAPPGSKGRFFSAEIRQDNRKTGLVAVLLEKPPLNSNATLGMLEMVAKVIGARLTNEKRDAELNFEKDIAAAVKHVEELYLAFPGISIGEISRAVLDEARRITGSSLGLAGCMHQASGEFRVSAMTREAVSEELAANFPLSLKKSPGLLGCVLKRKKTILTNNAPSDRRSGGLPEGHMKVHKFLGVPAMSGRKLLGMLALANPSRPYGPAELDAAQKLARVYALMLRHKLAEQQKQADDAKYKSILDTSSDLIFNMTVDGILTYVSRAIVNYGYREDEAIGRHFLKFVHPEDRGRLEKAFVSGVNSGRSLIPLLTYRLRKKDGSYATIEQKNSVLPRAGTSPIITGIIRDVTAARLAAERLAESELKYKTIFDKANAAILITDIRTGVVLDANRDAEKLAGRTREELIGLNQKELRIAEDSKRYKGRSRESARKGIATLAEGEFLRKDGTRAQVLISTSKLLLHGREALQGIFHDVTTQRQTERILRDLVEKNPLAIQILDKDGHMLKVNLAFTRIFGAVPPRSFSIFKDPQLKKRGFSDLLERVKKGEVVNFPDAPYNAHAVAPEAPDRLKWVRAVIFPLCDEAGKPERFVIMHEDITERKLAEDRRREEDERFRTIISSTKDVIFTVDLKGRITYVSPRVEDYGYTQLELQGRSITEIAHPEDRDFLVKAFANAIKTGRTLPIIPYRVKKKDGTYFYSEQKSGIVFINGKPAYFTGVMRDVTEQKKTETRLKESEELMRMVFETAKDAIFIKDLNGMYVKANKACAELLGTTTEGLIGHTDSEYLPAAAAHKVFISDSEVVCTGKTLSLNNFHPFPTGSRHVNIIKTPLRNVKGEIIGLLGIARDITDLKRTEAELALARASQAVSDVARPMAHDFNNALAAINGYATLIDDDLSDLSPIKSEISQIIKAVKRAAELTSKFQDFARNPKIDEKGGGHDK